MKGELYYLYFIVRWLIMTTLTLVIILTFTLENPSIVLRLIKQPLEMQGIKYDTIEGTIFNGLTLKGLNYQDKIVAKKVKVKVEWSKLKDRVLYINNIAIDDLHINKEYLNHLFDTNDSSSSDTNSSLPFDRIVINRAKLTLKDIIYRDYKVNFLSLETKNLTTDMKKEYRGDVKLTLDSNISKLHLNGSLNNNFAEVKGDIEINRKFLQPFIETRGVTLLTNPKFTIDCSGDKEKIKYHIITNSLGIKQDKYQIISKALILKGDYFVEKRDIKLNLDTKLSGNMGNFNLQGVGSANLDNLNKSLTFNIGSNINIDKAFLQSFIQDTNITILSNPNLNIKANGNMQNINYFITAKFIKLKQDRYKIKSRKLALNGDYNVEKKDIYLNIDTIIDTNLANVKLQGNSKLNLDDIDNTLKFNLNTDIQAHKNFLSYLLIDKNISISRVSSLNINLRGNLKKALFKINLKDLKATQNNIYLALSKLHIHGYSNILKGDTKFNLSSKLFSTAGDAVITNSTKLNLNNPTQTLTYKATAHIDAKANYINQYLKDENISVIDTPKINIDILNGSLDEVIAKINLKLDFLKNTIPSKLTLKSKPIRLNLKNHHIKGALVLNNKSSNMGFNINSTFNGDYQNLKKLKTNTQIRVQTFNNFGVNLNPLTPINLKLINGEKGAFLKIDSKRVKLNVRSSDYDKFSFSIKTGNLYLYKIVQLPENLYHKYIKLDLNGNYTVSNRYFNLNGYIYSNKKFRSKIYAQNSKFGLNAHIDTAHLKLKAIGNIDKKDIKVDISIDAIKEFQKEINKIYPITIADIDGLIDMKLSLKNEKVSAQIISPKLKLNGFNIEDIDIDTKYENDLITISRLNLRTTGFKDKKLNKNIHLNRDGKIYLSKKRDILIDMLPNILIVAKGTKDKLKGRVIVKQLPIGHPDYGSMFLNSNIYYKQIKDKKEITGYIYAKEMKLFYEPKFLDIDYDPDIIIITKNGKKIQQKLNDDSFLNNTYINLKVKAPRAEYRTPDIALSFDVNLNINKAYGKSIALLGRIEDINGRFDQVPKRFNIKNSTVIFKGGKKINPLLDIDVEYELPQVLIKIAIGGYANRPKIEFTSEPPMPKKDIMSYLLLGVSTANLSNGEGSLGREAELFILNQAARDFAYDFNLDKLFIKDDGTGEGYIIEAGKKITKRDTVIIESSTVGNSYILEHDFSKNIKLRVGQHQKEHPSQSIDIYFRKKF